MKVAYEKDLFAMRIHRVRSELEQIRPYMSRTSTRGCPADRAGARTAVSRTTHS